MRNDVGSEPTRSFWHSTIENACRKVRATGRRTGSCQRSNDRSDILPFTTPMRICGSGRSLGASVAATMGDRKIEAYLSLRCFEDEVRPELRLDPKTRTAHETHTTSASSQLVQSFTHFTNSKYALGSPCVEEACDPLGVVQRCEHAHGVTELLLLPHTRMHSSTLVTKSLREYIVATRTPRATLAREKRRTPANRVRSSSRAAGVDVESTTRTRFWLCVALTSGDWGESASATSGSAERHSPTDAPWIQSVKQLWWSALGWLQPKRSAVASGETPRTASLRRTYHATSGAAPRHHARYTQSATRASNDATGTVCIDQVCVSCVEAPPGSIEDSLQIIV